MRRPLAGGLKGNRIGKLSELVVRIALQELRDINRIVDFIEKDMEGIDFIITKEKNCIIPLQVKSSSLEAYVHKRKHESIPVIVVPHSSVSLRFKKRDRLVRYAKYYITVHILGLNDF